LQYYQSRCFAMSSINLHNTRPFFFQLRW
jgi:hypothetical protein